VVDAAMLMLERMGLTPADLLAAPAATPAAPTFAEYVPVVSALVSDGCRRAYGSYWNRVTDQWGSRGIDEPTPSEIRQLVQHVRATVVPRRNSRGGRSAAEHLIAALRCMYKHAEEDGLIDSAGNPARKEGIRPAARGTARRTRRGTRPIPCPPATAKRTLKNTRNSASVIPRQGRNIQR
jgi:integrase/recombinase XerC